ncbi:hypothetical protein CSU_1500, partial [Campylobacter jejuni subsp. jejuni 327]
MIAIFAKCSTIVPIKGRLVLSLSPPAPKTTMSFLFLRVSSTFQCH